VRTLPATMRYGFWQLAPLCSQDASLQAPKRRVGTVLPSWRRTKSSSLRAMGLDQEKHVHHYHGAVSRASWSSRQVSRVLLGLLVEAFVPDGTPLVVASVRRQNDATERRLGPRRLPRPSPFYPREHREEQRPQMGLRNVVGGGPLGFSEYGLCPS
jgi:hypothetical protein